MRTVDAGTCRMIDTQLIFHAFNSIAVNKHKLFDLDMERLTNENMLGNFAEEFYNTTTKYNFKKRVSYAKKDENG